MRRFSLLVGTILLLTMLTGCKTGKSSANDNADETNDETPAAIIGGKAGAIIGKQIQTQKETLQSAFSDFEATIETINRGEALKLTFNSDILFDANSSTLAEMSRIALRALALHLVDNPDVCAKIIGYTDGTGRAAFNRILSTRRAKSIRDLLTANGVDDSRTTYEGKGIRHPAASNRTAKGRALNRRIEIFVIPGEEMIRNARNGKKP
jgi:outer membrane protein OmpA-like peptidoglycan-associated protein